MSETKMAVRVREALAEDMSPVSDLVNHFIETSWFNFRNQPQTTVEWLAEWERYSRDYPWLIAETGDEIVGVAYAAPFKLREAYRWCAEVTIYVSPAHHKKGVGRALYEKLIPILQQRGFHSVVALVALPNPPSVALHEAFGFVPAGRLQDAGFKMGEWHDIGFWQLVLTESSAPPRATRPTDDGY